MNNFDKVNSYINKVIRRLSKEEGLQYSKLIYYIGRYGENDKRTLKQREIWKIALNLYFDTLNYLERIRVLHVDKD